MIYKQISLFSAFHSKIRKQLCWPSQDPSRPFISKAPERFYGLGLCLQGGHTEAGERCPCRGAPGWKHLVDTSQNLQVAMLLSFAIAHGTGHISLHVHGYFERKS